MLARHLLDIRLNHAQQKVSVHAEQVSEALHELVEEGRLPEDALDQLRVEIDWLQYKQNFREPVVISPIFEAAPLEAVNGNGYGLRLPAEMRIDVRRIEQTTLKQQVQKGLVRKESQEHASENYRVPLEDFKPFRKSIAWDFNALYWRFFTQWENWTGKGYEKALPGGISDAHHPLAVADSVADFWMLLRDLEQRKELPQEIFFLEIGVGTGTRAGMWLDKFLELDRSRGTNFYSRLRVLLGDYSLATLDSSLPSVKQHGDICSFLVLDALHPLKTLSFLRGKIMHIHTTNVYDNLPDQEFVRYQGKLYSVETRAYVPLGDVRKIGAASGVPVERFRKIIEQVADSGPDYFAGHARGMTFWQQSWNAMMLEDRIVAVDSLQQSPFPDGLDEKMLLDIVANVKGDVRFHVSSGALESFMKTLPLLHPRGYFQVQDIFVKDFGDYRRAFRGPGKMDGSIVNWVNGALLKGVAERSGYNVHFTPFHYRKGATTSVLYATRKNEGK